MAGHMRSLDFTTEATGGLCIASAMQRVVLEVLDVPEDYTSAEAEAITDSVYGAGILKAAVRGVAPRRPIRITWAALIEKESLQVCWQKRISNHCGCYAMRQRSQGSRVEPRRKAGAVVATDA